MASISKLQIRGIRSFSPNNDETIEFYSPLTMIVGMNGCGKTTIIECLKYGFCGSLPPGARNGQSFVNDPAMTDSSEVKAHVKLRFENRRGATCVAVRSMQVLRKKNKLEFKALDSVLKTINNDNEPVSISMKCSELDKQIPDLVGVSAAVMENVIFCHQEESDWPMQDGATVKKKFDDIFDSTRYSKALEALAKLKKDKASDSKDIKGETMELGAHLHNADQLKKDLLDCTDQQIECKDSLQAIDENLERLNDKIQESRKYIDQFKKAFNDIHDLKIRISEFDRRIEDKSTSITSIIDKPDADLQYMLKNFDSEMSTKSSELQKLQKEVDKINQSISKSRETLEVLVKKQGEAQAIRKQLEKTKADALASIINIARNNSIMLGNKDRWSSETCEDILLELRNKRRNLENECNVSIETSKRNVEEQELKLNQLRNNCQRNEITLSNNKKEMSKLLLDNEAKRKELSVVSSVAVSRDFNEAKSDLERVKSQLEENTTSLNKRIAELKQLQKENNDRMRSLDDDIQQQDNMLQDLNIHRNENLSLLADEKRLDEDKLEIKAKFGALLKQQKDILDTTGTANDQLQTISREHITNCLTLISNDTLESQRAHTKASNELTKHQQDTTKLETIIEQSNISLSTFQNREKDLLENEMQLKSAIEEITTIAKLPMLEGIDNIKALTSSSSPEEAMEQLDVFYSELKSLNDIIELESTAVRAIVKKRKDLSVDGNKCPCCYQAMDSSTAQSFKNNVQQIFSDINKKIRQAVVESMNTSVNPTKEMVNEYINVQLESCQRLKTLIGSLNPSIFQLSMIRRDAEGIRNNIADSKSRLLSLQRNEPELTSEVTDLLVKRTRYEKLNKDLNDLLIELDMWEKKNNDLVAKKKRSTQSYGSTMFSLPMLNLGTLSGDSSNISKAIEELEISIRTKREEKDELFKKLTKLRNEEDVVCKKNSSLQMSVHENEKHFHEMKARYDSFKLLEAVILSNSSVIDRLEEENKTLQRDLLETRQQMNENEAMLSSVQDQLSLHQDSKRDRLSRIDQEIHDIQSIVAKTNQLVSEDSKLDLEDILQQYKSCNQQIQQYEEDVRAKKAPINLISNELASIENTKRNILDNISLRQLRLESSQMKIDLRVKEEQSGAGNTKFHDIQRELQRYEQQQSKLQSERDVLVGKLQVHEEEETKINLKLNSKELRNISDRHRKKMIEYETTEMVIKDLDNYYIALDAALQNFHIQKIKEINKIIRELWQQVYKGQDIDVIEVESGQEATVAAGNAGAGISVNVGGKGSRSYNYRVVMKKGDIPLDMRGRCSAGQRILASIVIRLALAETFCLNCGILALDEPTTNLDDANKTGLAHALARLIQSRSRQQNFQLICITHDEEFVRLMNTELSMNTEFQKPNFYFRVSREEDGNSTKFFSHIERIPWDDM